MPIGVERNSEVGECTKMGGHQNVEGRVSPKEVGPTLTRDPMAELDTTPRLEAGTR